MRSPSQRWRRLRPARLIGSAWSCSPKSAWLRSRSSARFQPRFGEVGERISCMWVLRSLRQAYTCERALTALFGIIPGKSASYASNPFLKDDQFQYRV